MPYKNISDLPAAQVDQYSQHQKKAFLEAFNNAYEEYGGDESRAFAVAHSAAKKAGGAAWSREVREAGESRALAYRISPSLPLWKSSTAWRSSARVFITKGP
jgi:cation transport regulator